MPSSLTPAKRGDRLGATFEAMYGDTGRPSIPPERLLKASLRMALYSLRSGRLFCENLGYNILFRWFLGMSLEEYVGYTLLKGESE